jgi:hypothetical protein
MNDLRAALVVALALAALPARADERPFDWDRYHARQDACLEANRIAAACAGAGGIKYCDELSLREPTHQPASQRGIGRSGDCAAARHEHAVVHPAPGGEGTTFGET